MNSCGEEKKVSRGTKCSAVVKKKFHEEHFGCKYIFK